MLNILWMRKSWDTLYRSISFLSPRYCPSDNTRSVETWTVLVGEAIRRTLTIGVPHLQRQVRFNVDAIKGSLPRQANASRHNVALVSIQTFAEAFQLPDYLVTHDDRNVPPAIRRIASEWHCFL